VAVLGLAAVLWPAAPAAAHDGHAPAGTNYRTTITSVRGAVSGLTVRTSEAGQRLELTNHTGHTVEVLGYGGEPYLQVRPDGVYANTNSPATYLNRTVTGDSAVPTQASPTAAASWQRTSSSPVARWHDHRVHWMGANPPPEVAADPARAHRIRDWVIPLRDGTSTVEVRGTLDWLPPPAAGTWWALCLVGAAAVAGLGLLRRRLAAGSVALAVAAVAGGTVGVAYAVARELDAGTVGVGGMLRGLLTGQLWLLITSLAAIAAAGYALRRRPSADFALALAGACLLISAGVPNAVVFSRSVAPVGWDAAWARVAVAAVIVAGAGLTAAGVLRIRAALPQRQAAAAAAE
jgi:hypothetical protein